VTSVRFSQFFNTVFAMSQNNDAFLTIGDIFLILRKRWKLAIFGAFMFAVVGGLFVQFVLRPKYVSDGALYVRLGKNTLTVDPTASSSSTVSSLENRHQEVVSVKELLKSREVGERVCKRIGVEKILDLQSDLERFIADMMGKIKFKEGKLPEGMSKDEVVAQKDLESAIKYFNKAIEVDSPKDSYLIQIDAKAHDPLIARDMVQFAMEEYQFVHTAAHKPSGSFRFFEEQLAIQRDNVMALENKKRDELNRRHILSVEAERQLVQGRVASTTNRLSEVTSLLEGQRARVAELKVQFDAQPETLEMEQTGGIADAATDSIKTSVFALEVEHQKAAAIYNSSHPALIQKQKALAEAKEIEGAKPQDRAQHRNMINPNRMALQLEYARGIGDLENYESQLAWLDGELSELKLREKQLNEDEIFFNDLQRQLTMAVSEFNSFSQKREQSKLTEAIDQEAFSDVNIAQNATLNLTKSSISRLLMFALCLIGSGFFGGGCAFAAEILNGFVRQPAMAVRKPTVQPLPAPQSVFQPLPKPTVPVRENMVPPSQAIDPNPQGTYRIYSGRFRAQSPGGFIADDPKLDPIPGS
jgi:polysaccharide biosynthesis protein PslE